MKINKKQIFSALILSFAFLVMAAVTQVQAATAPQAGSAWNNQIGMEEIGAEYGETTSSADNLITIIIRIIDVALWFLAIIFVVLFIFSGYQWMMAGGNEDTIEKSKARMKNAIIGLVIVLVSWAITTFVIYRVLYVVSGNPSYLTEYNNYFTSNSGNPSHQ